MTTKPYFTPLGFGMPLLWGMFVLLFTLIPVSHVVAQTTCTPPPAGLVGWWPLDETSGTIASDLVGTSPGTLIGTTVVSGKVLNARRFAIGDRLTADGSGALDISGNQITIDAWIKLEVNPGSTQRFTALVGKAPPDISIVFESGGHGVPLSQWQFEYLLTNAGGTRVHNQSTGVRVTADGQYHHFAMAYDGTNVRLYVDGALKGTFSFSGNLKSDSTKPVLMFGGSNPVPFSIDEVEIFNRALSAAEIQAIFNVGSAGKCKPDSDGDGVLDADDDCAGTIIPESVPTRSLGINRFALVDGDDVFDTKSPKGKGPRRSYTTADTAGCSCTQIIDAQGLGNGHTKFGCSISAMDDWVLLVNP